MYLGPVGWSAWCNARRTPWAALATVKAGGWAPSPGRPALQRLCSYLQLRLDDNLQADLRPAPEAAPAAAPAPEGPALTTAQGAELRAGDVAQARSHGGQQAVSQANSPELRTGWCRPLRTAGVAGRCVRPL